MSLVAFSFLGVVWAHMEKKVFHRLHLIKRPSFNSERFSWDYIHGFLKMVKMAINSLLEINNQS
jgi:hypothetical protein